MSREIKFRAWQDGQMLTQPIPGNYAAARFFGFLYEDAPVMQFTGLKDKNGTEIYEGDIATHAKSTVYKYTDIITGEVVIEVSRGVVIGGWPASYDIEVIGNIYENPDLLDTKAQGKD